MTRALLTLKRKNHLIDESYNLTIIIKISIDKFNKIDNKSNKKLFFWVICLSLQIFKKHIEAAKTINKADIDKVYV